MTTANFTLYPKFQAFDDNGDPAVGYRLFTYVAGTTTKQTTYTTVAANVENTNPIVLDARGEANVCLDITLIYKLVLCIPTMTDPPTSNVWSVDNISAPTNATSLAGSGGAALTGYNSGAAGDVTRTVSDRLQDIVSVFDSLTSAQKSDIRAGTLNTTTQTGVTAAIAAANTKLAARGCGGTLFFPAGRYYETANISIPNKVSWLGETPGWTNAAGSAWNSGVEIYKAHTGDAVSMISSNVGGYIDNISVRSNSTTWAAGNGFVFGPAAGCVARRCNVFTVGGTSFVVGDNVAANSYTNCLEDCYSNNPLARNFFVGGPWFRGHKIISDGGTVGLFLDTSATNWSAGLMHFEGFTSAGISCYGANGATFGHNILLASTTGAANADGIIVHNTVGAQNNNFHDFRVVGGGGSGGTAGTSGVKFNAKTNGWDFTITAGNASRGATYTNNGQTFTVLVDCVGATTLYTTGTGAPAANGTLTKASGAGDATLTFSASGASTTHNVFNGIEGFTIENFYTGVYDAGNYNKVNKNAISSCTVPIDLSGDLYYYNDNVIATTVGASSIVHNSGTRGHLTGGTIDKAISAVASGSAGNFSGIRVSSIDGFDSRATVATGSIAVADASATGVAHGLDGIPSQVAFTTSAAGASAPILESVSASVVKFSWTGTTPATWILTVSLPCDP